MNPVHPYDQTRSARAGREARRPRLLELRETGEGSRNRDATAALEAAPLHPRGGDAAAGEPYGQRVHDADTQVIRGRYADVTMEAAHVTHQRTLRTLLTLREKNRN